MQIERDRRNKIIDGAMVAVKASGVVLLSGFAAAAGGRSALVPRPINMWKNQRRSRGFRDILEEAGVPMDFGVRVTFKGKAPKVSSLTWTAINLGCDKWELAYHLVKDGACTWHNGSVKTEIVR